MKHMVAVSPVHLSECVVDDTIVLQFGVDVIKSRREPFLSLSLTPHKCADVHCQVRLLKAYEAFGGKNILDARNLILGSKGTCALVIKGQLNQKQKL